MSKLQGFKKKANITLPLFKWANDVERYYRINSPVFVGKKIGDKEAARLANVTDLETGEEGQIIIGTVLAGIIEENFTGDEYVGRCFAITQHRIPEKKYNTYTLAEIEPDEAQINTEPEPVQAAGKRKK